MHRKIGEFDPSQETWTMYEGTIFCCKQDQRRQEEAAVLLTVSSASTYWLIRNLSYNKLVALLTSHCVPKRQRFQFHSHTQKPGETVAAFIAELWQLLEFCELGNTLEDMLCDRLVCGIANSSTQKRLLAEPELTLKKVQPLYWQEQLRMFQNLPRTMHNPKFRNLALQGGYTDRLTDMLPTVYYLYTHF